MEDTYLVYVIRAYEAKLAELMGRQAFKEFAAEISRRGFKKEIEQMAQSDFKDFILDNFEDITRL